MSGYKTIIAAILAMLGALAAWLLGELPGQQFFLSIWGCLIVIFARMGLDLGKGGFLAGYKTVLTAIAGVIGALGAYFSGQMGLQEMIIAVITAIMAIFFRMGIFKVTQTKY